MIDMIEIPKHVLAAIVWIDSDNPKYKLRSREAYPYCDDCKKNETEPMAYVYEDANEHLYVHCHRCGYTVSVARMADEVFF